MAVTGFWPVYRNLKATLDYADNPDKTTLPEYLDEDLYAALRYVENDNKTDRQVFRRHQLLQAERLRRDDRRPAAVWASWQGGWLPRHSEFP